MKQRESRCKRTLQSAFHRALPACDPLPDSGFPECPTSVTLLVCLQAGITARHFMSCHIGNFLSWVFLLHPLGGKRLVLWYLAGRLQTMLIIPDMDPWAPCRNSRSFPLRALNNSLSLSNVVPWLYFSWNLGEFTASELFIHPLGHLPTQALSRSSQSPDVTFGLQGRTHTLRWLLLYTENWGTELRWVPGAPKQQFHLHAFIQIIKFIIIHGQQQTQSLCYIVNHTFWWTENEDENIK